MSEAEYVLGTGDDELERLGLQHQLWSEVAHAGWARARVRPGSRVLDVGSGPGYAALDLAQLVGRSGVVLGVDESPGFVRHVQRRAREHGLPQLDARTGDVQRLGDLDLAPGSFDFAYARWVLCFVPAPEAVLAGVARLLAPGGRILVHDYFDYERMTMVPRRKSHDRVVAATARSWRERGGDPDVAGRVPGLLAGLGLEVESVTAHQRVARGGDALFAWPDTWWRTYTPRLVGLGLVSQAEAEELYADLDAVARSAGDFIVTPPVYEICARKPTT